MKLKFTSLIISVITSQVLYFYAKLLHTSYEANSVYILNFTYSVYQKDMLISKLKNCRKFVTRQFSWKVKHLTGNCRNVSSSFMASHWQAFLWDKDITLFMLFMHYSVHENKLSPYLYISIHLNTYYKANSVYIYCNIRYYTTCLIWFKHVWVCIHMARSQVRYYYMTP